MVDRASEPSFARYRPWFYAAALYNLIWGSITVLLPHLVFDIIGMERPFPLELWRVVGMFVLVYALAYWWAARRPAYFRHLILIGFLGKIFGTVGYILAVATGQLPVSFGWVICLNDVIWLVPFGMYLRDAARHYGGTMSLIRGE